VPFLIYRAESPLAPHDAQAALRAAVGSFRWFSRPTTPFAGQIYGHSFSICRVVSGRDSFNPMLYGRFLPAPRGTEIQVIITLHPLVWLLYFFWFGTIAYKIVREAVCAHYLWWPGLILLLFPLLISMPIFFHNTMASIELLRATLHLDEPSNPRG
jgi:hypothetical protein